MALPETIRVKLSSEEAGFVSITPVVAREIAVRELVELMLGITGKDVERVHELLLRGTLVSGASRFRWTGWDADRNDIEAMLGSFPDPEPARPFVPSCCVRAVLHGPGVLVEIPRDVGARRKFLRQKSFWDVMIEIALQERLRYVDYCYREHADRYQMSISPSVSTRLRQSAGMLRYSTLASQIRGAPLEMVEFFAERHPA
jgi:hypothetical protein